MPTQLAEIEHKRALQGLEALSEHDGSQGYGRPPLDDRPKIYGLTID